MTETVINTPQNPVTTSSVDANGDVVTDSSGNPAGNVVLREALAGERNPGTANEYGVGVGECNATVLDGTSAVAVSSGNAALVFGVLIITSGTTATIVGLTDQADAAKSVILTSSAASQFFDLKGMKVATTFTVTASVDDDVVVFWRDQ